MSQLARNILEASDDRKQDFISFFSTQTTLTDNTIAEAFSNDNILFGSALVTFIRLSLCHLADNTTTIQQQLASIYQGQNTNQRILFDNNVPPSPNSFINLEPSKTITNPIRKPARYGLHNNTNLNKEQPITIEGGCLKPGSIT